MDETMAMGLGMVIPTSSLWLLLLLKTWKKGRKWLGLGVEFGLTEGPPCHIQTQSRPFGKVFLAGGCSITSPHQYHHSPLILIHEYFIISFFGVFWTLSSDFSHWSVPLLPLTSPSALSLPSYTSPRANRPPLKQKNILSLSLSLSLGLYQLRVEVAVEWGFLSHTHTHSLCLNQSCATFSPP